MAERRERGEEVAGGGLAAPPAASSSCLLQRLAEVSEAPACSHRLFPALFLFSSSSFLRSLHHRPCLTLSPCNLELGEVGGGAW